MPFPKHDVSNDPPIKTLIGLAEVNYKPKTSNELWWFATMTHVWSLLRFSAPRSVHVRLMILEMCEQNLLAVLQEKHTI